MCLVRRGAKKDEVEQKHMANADKRRHLGRIYKRRTSIKYVYRMYVHSACPEDLAQCKLRSTMRLVEGLASLNTRILDIEMHICV